MNILDFMIVMPLGPDFGAALDIPLSHLGYVGGAYTASACVSGLACAFFLDRFDRRKALAVAMLGLVLGTLSGAFARGLASLMTARIVAGAFGGPATSLSYSIIADVIPSARRGKAMGAVMGAFSIASILGVPAGLELARLGGWKLPFIAVAALGAVLGTFAHVVLPPMTGHLAGARSGGAAKDIADLFRADVIISFAMSFVVMIAMFVLIPNISAFVQYNLGYPRAKLGVLYFAGGAASFVAMRVVGGLVDRFGSAKVGSLAVLVISIVIYLGFALTPPLLHPMATFIGFMLAASVRNVAYNTLVTKVPKPAERARFSSVQSAVQHLASALGAFASAQFLTENADHTLVGIPSVAMVSIATGLTLPAFFLAVERRVAATAQVH